MRDSKFRLFVVAPVLNLSNEACCDSLYLRAVSGMLICTFQILPEHLPNLWNNITSEDSSTLFFCWKKLFYRFTVCIFRGDSGLYVEQTEKLSNYKKISRNFTSQHHF